jgi:hypothetical protein
MPDVIWVGFIEGYALEKEGRGAPKGTLWKKGFPGLRVSDAETLSLQESAKSRNKNTELAALRQLYFCS